MSTTGRNWLPFAIFGAGFIVGFMTGVVVVSVIAYAVSAGSQQ